MRLKDKVVLITDGLSPSGKAIASGLIKEGALVVPNIPGDGNGGTGNSGLITHAEPVNTDQVEAAIKEILDKYGRIDVVVHNNNEVAARALESSDDAAYDKALDINMKSAFLFVRAACKPMKKARKGNFIFVTSVHDEKPNGFDFAYSLAKGSLKMFSKEMTLELGPYGIRTNLINVGPLKGEEELFYSDASPIYEHLEYRVVGGGPGAHEDVANAVIFFASDDSKYANGAELRVDGGFVLSYYQQPTSHAFDINAMGDD